MIFYRLSFINKEITTVVSRYKVLIEIKQGLNNLYLTIIVLVYNLALPAIMLGAGDAGISGISIS